MVASHDEPVASPENVRWQLAPGVSLLAGTALSGERRGAELYLLVAPSGHRYAVSEPLYRLAELLARPRAVAEVAAELAVRLGRPLDPAAAATLIESKLASRGLAVAEPTTTDITTREGESP